MLSLVGQTASIPSQSRSTFTSEESQSLLLSDSSSGTTYTPGQPIKLHDYGTSTYGKPSSGTAAPYPSSITNPATGTSTTTAPLVTNPSTTTSTTSVQPATDPTTTSTAAGSTDSTTANPAKKPRFGKLFNVLTNTLIGPGLGGVGAAPDPIPARSSTTATSTTSSSGLANAKAYEAAHAAANPMIGGVRGDGMRPNSELSRELQMAQLHEQQGKYYNAAQEWWYSIDLASGGLGFKERKQFMLGGTVAPGFQVKDIYKRALGCHVYMNRNYRTTHNTNGMMPSVYENMGSSFSKDLTCLQMSDPDNASWYYLGGVNWAGGTDNPLKYVHAYVELGAGLSCKQGLTPTIKQKMEALREHIRLAAALELADLDRAKYENMMAQVQNIEHPTITIYRDADTGRVVDINDSSNTLYKWYYPMMKDMIKNDYPSFKGRFDRLVAYCRSRPNGAAAIPPFSPDDEAAHYVIPETEQKAFGPVEYRTRNFI
jgi:hypothetical protein